MTYSKVLLVLGNVGVGKSTLLNEIIGAKRFETSDSENHCTTIHDEAELEDFLVVDGPGFDLNMDSTDGVAPYRGKTVYVIFLGRRPRKIPYVDKVSDHLGIEKKFVNFFFRDDVSLKSLKLCNITQRLQGYAVPRVEMKNVPVKKATVKSTKKKKVNLKHNQPVVFLNGFVDIVLLEKHAERKLNLNVLGPEVVPSFDTMTKYRMLGDAHVKLKTEQMVVDGILDRQGALKLQSNPHMHTFISSHEIFLAHALSIYSEKGAVDKPKSEKIADVFEALVGRLYYDKSLSKKYKKQRMALMISYLKS